MQRKPWSIATAIRNPDRLRGLLAVFRQLEGLPWTHDNQEKFQILLIQNRLYGYDKRQFYNGLSDDDVKLISDLSHDITYSEAESIFRAKNYEDPPMRGRQSFNPLRKMGLATTEHGSVKITELGGLLLCDDYDLGEVFFRSLLKWQILNRAQTGYFREEIDNINPFIGTLHLINAVNQKESGRGNAPKGLSRDEFDLFVPTLTHYHDINEYAGKIIALRDRLSTIPHLKKAAFFADYARKYAGAFLGTSSSGEIQKLLNNLRDYGDNIRNYFRLTRYIHIRGNGYYIDLESRRSIEIESLLSHYDGSAIRFASKQEHAAFMADMHQPVLPWETTEKYIEIIHDLVSQLSALGKTITLANVGQMSKAQLKKYASKLRGMRQDVQERQLHEEMQNVDSVEKHVQMLENIRDYHNRHILIEKLSALGLRALNDAIKIQPNHPVGDDNEPTSTAPGNMPDIECFYKDFNAICEVTMTTGRDQWYLEGQPVMRHLRDFENKHDDKSSYCVFIAPALHRDTINTFWIAVKYEYEGVKQKIIPLTISDFVLILKALMGIKRRQGRLTQIDIMNLYESIFAKSGECGKAEEWMQSIPAIIAAWRDELSSRQ